MDRDEVTLKVGYWIIDHCANCCNPVCEVKSVVRKILENDKVDYDKFIAEHKQYVAMVRREVEYQLNLTLPD